MQDKEYNSEEEKLVQINLNIIACEDSGDTNPEYMEGDSKDLAKINARLNKELIQKNKINEKLQQQMNEMKNELYELQAERTERDVRLSEELERLRNEVIEKMDLIRVLEADNQDLIIRSEKAEEETRAAVQELQELQDQNLANGENNPADKDEQIVQMHEDMQRLLDFKNELEALIEEQNKDIEEKSEKINAAMNEVNIYKNEAEKNDNYIKNIEKQLKDYKIKVNSVTSKLNRLKGGKIAELQKKNRDLSSELEMLKEMMKSSKNELRSKDISIKKFKKRLTSLEKISKIRSKVSELNSMHSQNSQTSQRNHSIGKHHETYEYEDEYDNYEDNDEVIVEAAENLEGTGNQDPYYNGLPLKQPQYSKTPNIRVSKNLNNSKIAGLHKLSPDRLRADNSMPKMEHNPFKKNVNKGYEHYKESLKNQDFKNNSYGIKGVFTHPKDQFELPAIKESQGAVIFDRRRLDSLKKDSEDTRSTTNISNTYKQSYKIY